MTGVILLSEIWALFNDSLCFVSEETSGYTSRKAYIVLVMTKVIKKAVLQEDLH